MFRISLLNKYVCFNHVTYNTHPSTFMMFIQVFFVYTWLLINCILCFYSIHSRALVFISHGVTEHMGRYNSLAQFLTDSGILVFGHDHGKVFCIVSLLIRNVKHTEGYLYMHANCPACVMHGYLEGGTF